MLEQFLKSILALLYNVVPMNAYIQRVPIGAKYPYYQINKVDISQDMINSFFINNTLRVYIRVWGEDEVALNENAFAIQSAITSGRGIIPILNQDGTQSNRVIRIEDIESIPIQTDVNEVYCVELNFKFETFLNVSAQEFDLIAHVHAALNATTTSSDNTNTTQVTIQ
jgi:hypothetical protein